MQRSKILSQDIIDDEGSDSPINDDESYGSKYDSEEERQNEKSFEEENKSEEAIENNEEPIIDDQNNDENNADEINNTNLQNTEPTLNNTATPTTGDKKVIGGPFAIEIFINNLFITIADNITSM